MAPWSQVERATAVVLDTDREEARKVYTRMHNILCSEAELQERLICEGVHYIYLPHRLKSLRVKARHLCMKAR